MWTVKEKDGKFFAYNSKTKEFKGKGYATREEALARVKTMNSAEGAGRDKVLPKKEPVPPLGTGTGPVPVPNPIAGQLPPGMGGPMMPGAGGPPGGGMPPGMPPTGMPPRRLGM